MSRKSFRDKNSEYVKPSRLVPATEVKVCNDTSFEKTPASFLSGKSESLYKIKIQTSNTFGSGLSDVNSEILICLIDENGTSILQRLPVTSSGDGTWTEDKVMNDILHFQRGSVDEFAFEGPNLGRIVAVWISLESGQWRISGLSLTTIAHSQPSSAENKYLSCLQYSFEFEDILLGEKSEASMMEFRPHSVTSFSDDESTFFNSLNASASIDNYFTSNEESMKEYSNLKLSLLLYDSVLIFAGSTFAYFLTGEHASYAFLTGGMFGLFYLLLLQRSVDGISAQEFVPSENKGNFGQFFGRLNLKGPISSLVLTFAFAVIALKYASGEDAFQLTPKDVVFGMMGFLMCKVSVVLAAFKPVPLGLGDNE
ncbi:hypothetical protein PHJA_001392800 [Phtheirospermum japonicum]|uniref:DUF7755 domain-containing protein n=1 Tax=Phtheirospermum japonicum TaxID=374723 RepID=A0A830C048_9LAMI|nr:hypothetical protein PHJA_001392800 [Phtheirospermum japonicum]